MWVKTGDEFVDDAADLSDAAVRTMLDAWHWNARRLLDLHIPKRDLPRFAFSPDAGRAVDELVTLRWWVDEGSSWYLAYRPEWQLSRDQVERRRNQNQQAQERARRHRKGDHSLCLIEKCPSAADTSADTSHDTADDEADYSASDPVRFGSVRKDALKELQEAAVVVCRECQRRAAFSTGPCPDHINEESRAAS
jgi:hypothetical protein